MEGGYLIRRARPEDLDTIVRFNRAMARETEDLGLEDETIRAGVEALLADPSKGHYLVADWQAEGPEAAQAAGQPEAAQAAGQLMVTPEWSDWRNGHVWWIQSVYVAPAHRRRGVYRLLHEHVREAARAEGIVGLRLYVDRENRTAQATYRRLGMSESRYVLYEEIWA